VPTHSEKAEAQLLGMIAKELNEKCGQDLALDFSTDRCLYGEERSLKIAFIWGAIVILSYQNPYHAK